MGIGSQAFPTWQTSQRVVSTWPKEAIERVLNAGLVSVFHGDCVLDSDQGCCILSGDTIIKVSSCDLYLSYSVGLGPRLHAASWVVTPPLRWVPVICTHLIVWDSDQGFCIRSGDTIIKVSACDLYSSHCLWLRLRLLHPEWWHHH